MADNEIGIRVTSKDDTGSGFSSVKKSSDDAASSLDRVGEAADGAEGKAQGFSDTLTGTADVMSGASQIAKGDLFGGLVTLGGGVADLAGGMASFLIPALKGMSLSSVKARAATIAQTAATKALTIAQKAMNLVMRMNPIGLVVTAIVLLVGALVLAYKKSETFRNIVNGAFNAVKKVAGTVFGWIKDTLGDLFEAIASLPGKISGLAGKMLGAGKTLMKGLFNGLKSAASAVGGFAADIGKAIVNKIIDFLNGILPHQIGIHKGPINIDVPLFPEIPHLARGGITGAAASRMAVVGERGRELVRLPVGSSVIPNGQTERMLADDGRSRPSVEELGLTKEDIEDAFSRALSRLPIFRLPNDGQAAYLQAGF